MTPAEALAHTLNGALVEPDRIQVDGALIYSAINGRVRVQQYGRPVVTIGAWSDATDTLATAFHDATRPVRDAGMAALRAGGVG